MNTSSGKPPRRRRSSLAEQHPAYPTPAPEPTQDRPPSESERDEFESRAATRPPAHDATPDAGPSRAAEQRARADARNAAWSWAKAAVRLDRRVAEWCDEMRRARQSGTAPAVLREYIGEAAERVGIDPGDVPREVWRAAGVDPPDRA